MIILEIDLRPTAPDRAHQILHELSNAALYRQKAKNTRTASTLGAICTWRLRRMEGTDDEVSLWVKSTDPGNGSGLAVPKILFNERFLPEAQQDVLHLLVGRKRRWKKVFSIEEIDV